MAQFRRTGACLALSGILIAIGGTAHAQGTSTLTVVPTGSGSGTVTSVPPGIDCGTTCAQSYPAATFVELSPSAAAGSVFSGWRGDAECVDEEFWMSGSMLSWEQNDADAPTLTYRLYLNGLTQGTLQGVVCDTLSLPASCTASFPSGFAPTPGAYLMEVRAERGAVVSRLAGIDITVPSVGGTFAVRVPLTLDRACTVKWTTLFTDDPLQPWVTPVRVVHFVELRNRIDTLRLQRSLGAFSWTDSLLSPGAHKVRAVHISEMRTALAQVYSHDALAAPTFSNPLTVAGDAIRASDINELRVAVVAVE